MERAGLCRGKKIDSSWFVPAYFLVAAVSGEFSGSDMENGACPGFSITGLIAPVKRAMGEYRPLLPDHCSGLILGAS